MKKLVFFVVFLLITVGATGQKTQSETQLIEKSKLEKLTKIYYLYIFNEGSNDPVGYYKVNWIVNLNQRLNNPKEIRNKAVLETANSKGDVSLPKRMKNHTFNDFPTKGIRTTNGKALVQTDMNYIFTSIKSFPEARLLGSILKYNH